MMTRYTHVQLIAELPGSAGFMVWGVETRDDIATVLAPGNFGANARVMNDGDIVVVNRRPLPGRRTAAPRSWCWRRTKDMAGSMTLRQILHRPTLHPPALPQARRKAGNPKSVASDMG